MLPSKNSDTRPISGRALIAGCILAAALIITLHFEHLVSNALIPLSQSISALAPAPSAVNQTPSGLAVTTLAYRVPYDHKYVTHNCRMIKGTRHRFLIYTDDMSAPFCQVCTCRRFEPTNCPPPKKRKGAVNHCEKLAFVARMVTQLREMVYLDSDLIVIKRSFLDRLQIRSQAHDFLASYVHVSYRDVPKHYALMNSGLFFMRFLPTANYSDLMARMYKYKTGKDQGILSGFVFDTYENWDTLSWKWHCRGIFRMQQDTPVKDCFTIHDRGEQVELRKKLNYTLLTIP